MFQYENENDEYSSIMVKALADGLQSHLLSIYTELEQNIGDFQMMKTFQMKI